MTTEQKAKAYDEAIEELRGMMPNWERLSYNGKTFLQDLVHIFPELKESKGEKIRKALMQNLKERFGTKGNMGEGLDMPDVLAWLEKQGGKTAWSEDDENRINRLIAYFEDKESFTAEDDVVYANWLNSLKDRVQPKQEWSEEELDSITAAINNLEYFKNNCVYHQMGLEPAITFLKSLKDRVQPQPKQEWSEEDGKYINDLIAYFAADMSLKHTEEDIVNWLKSLRPQSQWKPSDEQMGVIEAVINNRSFQRRHLDSLYEQLKKLRGE